MRRFLELIGILLGVLLSFHVLELSIDEIPFAAVNLTTNGVITKLANGSEQHQNEFTIGSPFLLNCSFAIVKKEYNLKKVTFHLNRNLLGSLEISYRYDRLAPEYNEWEIPPYLDQNWDLNVYTQSSPKAPSLPTSFSIWIQPLSTKASGNYSCLVLLRNNKEKVKFVSNIFPIRIKPID